MNRKILTLAGAAVLLLAGTPVALAQTTAGTQVKNEVSVSYEVGGVGQTDEADDASFLVDRRVDLVVNESGGAMKSIVPDATPDTTNGYYLTYTVTNNTNDVIDIKLAVAELSGETVLGEADTEDTADTPTYALYIDNEVTGTVGSWDAGDAAVASDGPDPYLDQVAAGDLITVFVVPGQFSDDSVLDNDDIIGLKLTGTAASAWDDPTLPILVDGTEFPTARVADAGALGDDLVNDTDGDSSSAVENVFADAVDDDGSLDAANNGRDDAYDAFRVVTAAITVTKRSTVYYDPVTGDADGLGAEPKAIPGALVLYCITITNTGDEDADNVVVSDAVPSNTAFVDANSDVANEITASDSIRFSTDDSCTFTDWDNGTVETSDATDGGSDNLTGDYDVTTTGAVTTEVPTLGDTTGVTTTMFMVEIQ